MPLYKLFFSSCLLLLSFSQRSPTSWCYLNIYLIFRLLSLFWLRAQFFLWMVRSISLIILFSRMYHSLLSFAFVTPIFYGCYSSLCSFLYPFFSKLFLYLFTTSYRHSLLSSLSPLLKGFCSSCFRLTASLSFFLCCFALCCLIFTLSHFFIWFDSLCYFGQLKFLLRLLLIYRILILLNYLPFLLAIFLSLRFYLFSLPPLYGLDILTWRADFYGALHSFSAFNQSSYSVNPLLFSLSLNGGPSLNSYFPSIDLADSFINNVFLAPDRDLSSSPLSRARHQEAHAQGLALIPTLNFNNWCEQNIYVNSILCRSKITNDPSSLSSLLFPYLSFLPERQYYFRSFFFCMFGPSTLERVPSIDFSVGLFERVTKNCPSSSLFPFCPPESLG